MQLVLLLPGAAGVLAFLCLFPVMARDPTRFWLQMGLTNLVLALWVLAVDPQLRAHLVADLRSGLAAKLAVGLAAALFLYAVFWVGEIALTALDASSTEQGLSRVYGLKAALPSWQIALLLVFVIGPGEEIFWRGFVQRQLARRAGPLGGLAAAAALYALVHATGANPLLVMAALTCGIFWGWLYAWRGSLWINIVSHIAWDLAVFLVRPLG